MQIIKKKNGKWFLSKHISQQVGILYIDDFLNTEKNL